MFLFSMTVTISRHSAAKLAVDEDVGPWITRVYIRFTRGNQFFFNQAVNEIDIHPKVEKC